MGEHAGRELELFFGFFTFADVGIDPDAALVGLCRIDGATIQRAPKHAAILVAQQGFFAVAIAFGQGCVGALADSQEVLVRAVEPLGTDTD